MLLMKIYDYYVLCWFGAIIPQCPQGPVYQLIQIKAPEGHLGVNDRMLVETSRWYFKMFFLCQQVRLRYNEISCTRSYQYLHWGQRYLGKISNMIDGHQYFEPLFGSTATFAYVQCMTWRSVVKQPQLATHRRPKPEGVQCFRPGENKVSGQRFRVLPGASVNCI